MKVLKTGLRMARKLLDKKKWQRFPQVIQIDTNNHCGPAYCDVYCTYCFPAWQIMTKKRGYAEMPTNIIELILDQVGRYGKNEMDLIDFFLNGDGFTEPRLPELHKYAKKVCPDAITQTFTNGILYKNYEAALPLDRVCFTISAHNRELYRIVHRGDKFLSALLGLELTLDNRRENQRVEVHCVLTKDNIPYAKDWWAFFGKNYPDAVRILSPLVASYDNKPSLDSMGNYTLNDMEKLVIDIAGSEGRMWTRTLIPDEKPCVLFDNLSIDVGGYNGKAQNYLLQCCNWSSPKDWNYGTVQQLIEEGRTLKDMWRKRLKNQMKNKLCDSCCMKHPQWQSRLAKMRVLA